MRNGIGQFIMPPVANDQVLWTPTTTERPYGSTTCHLSSTYVWLIRTCITSGCRVPVGSLANNSQCTCHGTKSSPTISPHRLQRIQDSTHHSAHSPTLSSTGRRGPHTAKSRSRDILAGDHWTARASGEVWRCLDQHRHQGRSCLRPDRQEQPTCTMALRNLTVAC